VFCKNIKVECSLAVSEFEQTAFMVEIGSFIPTVFVANIIFVGNSL